MAAQNPGTVRRFMAGLFTWLVTAPILALLVLFAVSNRQDVTLQLWPLPFEVTLPLSLLLLGILLLTFLLGLFIGWLGQHGTRREARLNRREVARLQKQIADAPRVTTAAGTTTTIMTPRVTPATVMADTHFKDSL